MTYVANPARYDAMTYRRCGRSGVRLPAISLGLWHNFGDADTVGERLTNDLAVGIDGFTLNMPANGRLPGRVTLLGETAAKVVG